MSINLRDFKKVTKYTGLYKSIKETKLKGYKYFARFKLNGKIYKKVLGYSRYDALTDRSAYLMLEKFKKDLERGYTVNKRYTLEVLFDEYLSLLNVGTTRYRDVKSMYNANIKSSDLNNVLIEKIKESDILRLIKKLDEKGLSKKTQQNIIGLLKRIYKYAIRNKYTYNNPVEYVTIKVPKNKKIVIDAVDTFKKIYDAINDIFANDPFYKALFLFGLFGRRRSEILNLKWENIDLRNGYYWIEDTKNNEQQKYVLPKLILKELLQIPDDKKGLVFKSPVTGGQIKDIRRQTLKIRKKTNIENFSMHYLRNVLVSALAEQGTDATVLSSVLGHKSSQIIDQYLTLSYYKSSEKAINILNDILKV